jgi:hypothetical protein
MGFRPSAEELQLDKTLQHCSSSSVANNKKKKTNSLVGQYVGD